MTLELNYEEKRPSVVCADLFCAVHHSLAQLLRRDTVALGTDGVAVVSWVTMSRVTLESSFSEVSGRCEVAEPLAGRVPMANAGPSGGTAHTTSNCWDGGGSSGPMS